VTGDSVTVIYEDPLDPGPHTHSLEGADAIVWRPTATPPDIADPWFKKVLSLIQQVRKASLAMVRFFLY